MLFLKDDLGGGSGITADIIGAMNMISLP